MAQALGMGVMPWSPLQERLPLGQVLPRRGRLGRHARAPQPAGPSEADYDVIDALYAVAAEVGASPAAVALAWVRGRPGVTSTLVGARRLDQLEANLAGLDLMLTEAQIAGLDEVSTPTLNFPADINARLGPVLGFAGHDHRRAHPPAIADVGGQRAPATDADQASR